MVVVSGVIALPSEKRLQAILSIDVHRQKLLAIFPRKVAEQLRMSRCRDSRAWTWIWNVSRAGHRRRSDACRLLIFRVSFEHKDIEVLFAHQARKRTGACQLRVVPAPAQPHRNSRHAVQNCLKLSDVPCDQPISGLEAVIVIPSRLQAADIGLFFLIFPPPTCSSSLPPHAPLPI